MNPAVTTVKSKVTAIAASAALGMGGLIAGAQSTAAAPGDLTTYLVGNGAKPVDIITGPDGTMWAANEGDDSISRVTTNGQITSFPVPGVGPNSLTFGPDGAVWFTYSGTAAVGRMATNGSARNYPTGVANGQGSDIEVGFDDNLWFTMPNAQLVGRISTSGNVIRYAGTGAVQSITRGPGRSGQMYFSAGTGEIGSISATGARSAVAIPGARSTGPVQNVGGSIWFGMTDTQGQLKLGKLTNGTATQISIPQLTSINQITAGRAGTIYVTDSSSNRVVHITDGGAVAAVFNSGANTNAATLGADANVWVAAGATNTPGEIRRIESGVVPEVTNNGPFTTPTQGLSVGATVLASTGAWRYDPSSYSYQWQSCTTRSASTCSDIPGATSASYVVAATDIGKFLRVGVIASNSSGPSIPAFSTFASTNGAGGSNAPGLATVASIGGDYTMQLRAPTQQRRKQRSFYIVTFSAEDTEGTVTFEFRKGSRTQTKTVTISDDEASYRWKPPRRWRKGASTVTATFQPTPGSELTQAVVGSRVRIR